VFSEIDTIIFPDSCEVIEILPSQLYVYPIFKCGRSSLVESMPSKGWKFVAEQDIKKIAGPITIFLRDPRERFLSGVNTYIQHLVSEDNDLDIHTMLYFVNRYLFLNRHYAPQFFWLLNLYRFANADVEIKLCHMSDINQLTERHSHAAVDPITPELRDRLLSLDWSKLELHFYLDQLLLDRVGQTVGIRQLLDQLQTQHTELFDLVFKKTQDIVHVLPKT
jgi:hypothetical protein